jgi:cytochrome-b5 reductase
VSLAKLAGHASADDAWMALRGKVYDVTPYMACHPGGVAQLMKGVGE